MLERHAHSVQNLRKPCIPIINSLFLPAYLNFVQMKRALSSTYLVFPDTQFDAGIQRTAVIIPSSPRFNASLATLAMCLTRYRTVAFNTLLDSSLFMHWIPARCRTEEITCYISWFPFLFSFEYLCSHLLTNSVLPDMILYYQTSFFLLTGNLDFLYHILIRRYMSTSTRKQHSLSIQM
jgi:hypothetical protein